MCHVAEKERDRTWGLQLFSDPEIFISGVDFVLFVNVAFQKQKSLLFVRVNK